MTDNEEEAELPASVARIRLDTLSTVRTEMAKLYRLARGGKLELENLGKFIYALKEIRCCLESETLERIEAQMAELSDRAMIVQNRHGQSTYVQ